MCRVSPSFVRFGTFQLPAMRGGDQLPLVRTLADYVIRHLYPHLEGELPIHLPHLSRMNTLGSHNTFIHASSRCWDSSQRCRDLWPLEAPGLKPHVLCCAGKADKYAELLREVVRRTASLVAQWQAVGFVHGVGNTDNFSILGETIDYGCALAPSWQPARSADIRRPWS